MFCRLSFFVQASDNDWIWLVILVVAVVSAIVAVSVTVAVAGIVTDFVVVGIVADAVVVVVVADVVVVVAVAVVVAVVYLRLLYAVHCYMAKRLYLTMIVAFNAIVGKVALSFPPPRLNFFGDHDPVDSRA
ncbi:MAG: hypothetical protein ACREBR_03195 [bacterium]